MIRLPSAVAFGRRSNSALESLGQSPQSVQIVQLSDLLPVSDSASVRKEIGVFRFGVPPS